MADPTPDIVIAREPLETDVLRTLVARFFEDMVKYVVDVERGVAAVGGELHADAEALLLEDGSQQDDPGLRERVLRLTDLTVGMGGSRGLRRGGGARAPAGEEPSASAWNTGTRS